MCNKQQTSVEWLVNWISDNPEHTLEMYIEAIQKAKEIEEQQKIDFAKHCLNKAKDLDVLTSFMNVEKYYDEFFKSK